jgi:hypothetical protein
VRRELELGDRAVDNVGNTASPSVTFSIVVTADSIKDDVNEFVASGDVAANLANSLLAKLAAAAADRAHGDCDAAANLHVAFVNELQAQSEKSVSAAAAAIMIGDAKYLIAHCP